MRRPLKNNGKADKYIDAASWFLVLAVFSLVWRINFFVIPVPKPFELVVLVIGAMLAVSALRSSLPRFEAFIAAMGRYWFLVILFVAPLLGLVGSSLTGFMWQEYVSEAALEYARLLFGFFSSLVVAYLAFLRPAILTYIFAAIATSSLIMWVALVPSLETFFLDAYRLRGMGIDPNHLAVWIAIGLIASITFFLWDRSKVRWWWLVNGLLIAPLLLWTGSRTSWLAMVFVFSVVSVLFLAERFSAERFRLLGLVCFGIVASLVLGFLLFPVSSRTAIATRVMSPFVSNERLTNIVHFIAGRAEEIQIPFENRTWLWREGMRRFLRSPLGFGPAYYHWYPIGFVGVANHKLSVHNLWLEVGLTAGWFGFGTWIVFMGMIGREAVRLARHWEPQFLALAASFFIILFIGFFIDMLGLRWPWLIIGLIAAYSFLDSSGELPTLIHEKSNEA